MLSKQIIADLTGLLSGKNVNLVYKLSVTGMHAFHHILNQINLIGAFQALFLGAALWVGGKGYKPANRLLAIQLVLLSYSIFYYNWEISGYLVRFPFLFFSSVVIAFTYGPLIYMYIRIITERSFHYQTSRWLHLLPALLCCLYYLPFLFFNPQQQVEAVHRQYLYLPFDFVAWNILTSIQSGTYLLVSFLTVMRHEQRMKNYFSDTEKVNLAWLRLFLFLLMIVWSICLIVNGGEIYDLNVEASFFISLIIYIIGYKSINQQAPFLLVEKTLHPDTNQNRKNGEKTSVFAPRYSKAQLPEALRTNLHTRLLMVMEQQSLYLNAELDIRQLSDALGITPHQLSQLLNQQIGKTFYDFVNQYRVEAVKRLIEDRTKDRFTLLALGYEAGFNSKAAFNTSFKKVTGITPSQYKHQVLDTQTHSLDYV